MSLAKPDAPKTGNSESKFASRQHWFQTAVEVLSVTPMGPDKDETRRGYIGRFAILSLAALAVIVAALIVLTNINH